IRSSVSMVMRLPSRKRCTSLPSLTARRPNVVSAMSAWRQNSEIWLRIWSFFIRPDWGSTGGQRRLRRLSYHHLPNGEMNPCSSRRNKTGDAFPAAMIAHCRGPFDAPFDPDARLIRVRTVIGAVLRPIARATRAALAQRRPAGRPADRRLQQDHRAKSVYRREAGGDLFLARGRLEQEGQLQPGHHRCQRGDPPEAECRAL